MIAGKTNKHLAWRAAKAFTLVEILVVIGIMTVLIAMLLPALNKALESVHTLQCALNMPQIGLAMQTYANDNRGRYPWACLHWDSTARRQAANVFYAGYGGYTVTQLKDRDLTWDDMIESYLGVNASQTALMGQMPTPNPILICPSDDIPCNSTIVTAAVPGARRSYAMNGTRTATTVAIDPRQTQVASPLGVTAGTGDSIHTGYLDPSITYAVFPYCYQASDMPQASETILVAERPSSNNVLGTDNDCVVISPVDQLDTATASRITYLRPTHAGNKYFNYLFVDGHVSTMLPTETIGADIQGLNGHGYMGKCTNTAVLTANGWSTSNAAKAPPLGAWTRDPTD